MKLSYVKIILLWIITFHNNFCFSEGFASGTLIKVYEGYTKIEDLVVGNYVTCYDAEHNFTQGLITHISKKSVNHYVRIEFDNEYICVAQDQRLYDENLQLWVIANSLKDNDVVSGKIFTVRLIHEPIDLYLISIAYHHNFLFSLSDICAHNFFPIVIGISLAFGAGSLEIAGLTCGIAGFGTFLGYQWHKKNKQNHNVIVEFNNSGNRMMPEDPDEEKKKKRDKAREEFRPLTNKEAREQAKQMGYKEDKNPSFDTHGDLAFKKNNIYISPDNTGHNGGVWKMFKRNGQRIGTWNKNLTERIKG